MTKAIIFFLTPQNNDYLRNTVHRHEPPVVGRPLKILVNDGEVLVVDKPASIPVHPCGRFRHNTVMFILGKELGIPELHTVHRLDKLTSGVLLFARTLETSKKLDQLVRDRQVRSALGGFKLSLDLRQWIFFTAAIVFTLLFYVKMSCC